MSRLIYSLLLYLISPLVVLRLMMRARKAPAYKKRWGERFGFFNGLDDSRQTLWIHSVSVGETLASAPMVKQLIALYPNHRFLITTTTPTGSDRVKALYGDRVDHVYFPYDLPGAQRRFLKATNPVLALIVETELWPNTIHECYRRRIPVVIANARLSEKSAKGYRRLGGLINSTLQKVHTIACQNEEDGQRFRQLGLPDDRLRVTGSFKFDLEVALETLSAGSYLRRQWQKGLGRDVRILVAASTHEGEDQPILSAFKRVQEKLGHVLLVLVPRHPERFDSVHRLIEDNELSVIRHSKTQQTYSHTQVILGDTMGELMTFFAAADIAFVGGSLIEKGGHNLLEPAAIGLPVLSGPSVYNFSDISRMLVDSGGMALVDDAQSLGTALIRLLENEEDMRQVGQQAKAVVEDNRGALKRLMAILRPIIDT